MSEANRDRLKKQKSILAAVAGVVAVGAFFYVTSGSDDTTNTDRAETLRKRKMSDVINPPNLDDSFFAQTNQQFSSFQKQLDTLNQTVQTLSEENKRKELEAIQARQELEQTRNEAETIIEELASQAARASQVPRNATLPSQGLPPVSGDPFSRGGVVNNGVAPTVSAPPLVEPATPRTMDIVRFEPASAKLETGVVQPAIFQTTEGDYVPPNAYAKATVLVGVDMTTGVRLGADPKPVLLRITGPAYSVLQGGQQLDTDLSGCLVNGAANAELSSERVFVRLQKITCDRGNGEVAENEVEGYIAQLGRVGVRGRVVSREGDIAVKALLAGTLSGIGNGVSRTSEFGFAGVSGGATTVIGADRPNAGEIAGGAIGEGLSTAADNVADYLIERAEQYEPVIEMPTGIDVEIVFLSGFFARGEGS